jgi:pimeloyl-ACP methyl ester carboxylesterase
MSTSPQAERLLIRVHGDASLPTLIYLPGLHGDWTLVSSFRAAVAGRVRFVEFTYPRSLTTSAADYAAWVEEALAAQGITQGWLLAESFGSQVAWALIERQQQRASSGVVAADVSPRHSLELAPTDVGGYGADAPLQSAIGNRQSAIQLQGLILVGGFVKHPWPWGARLLRWQAAHTPARLLRVALRGYEAYAGFRHRHAPETQASIREFVERRTPLDSEAIRARLELIAANDPRPIARRTTLPVHYLAGLVDPLVPWPFVRWWLRRHCPSYRGGTTLWSADHNALATKPRLAAEFVLGVMGAPSSSRSTAQAHFGSSPS